MVNSIATKRGKAKEHLREFVVRVSGFCQNMKKQEVIQRNLDRFNELYPNSFHCKASTTLCYFLFDLHWVYALTSLIHQSSNPRRGDYEHPEIAHCIALIIFHGSNSVGVLYPEYFREMPLTTVAFCLAIVSFIVKIFEPH
jgi:hypothetical protein